jgi:hypothetical protein
LFDTAVETLNQWSPQGKPAIHPRLQKDAMRIVLALFLLLIFSTSNQPNSWRGISPLRSTCEDVKKILQVESCPLPQASYTVPGFRVMIEFSNDDCGKSPRAWRVPKGTVLSLVVSPEHTMTVSQLGLDLSKFKKRDSEEIVGVEQYDNNEEGISVETFQGYVMNLFLSPRKGDDSLLCKPANK